MLYLRLAVLAVLLFGELLVASFFFDTRDLVGKGAIAPQLKGLGPLLVRWFIAFCIALALFGWSRLRTLAGQWEHLAAAHVRTPFLAAHVISAAGFAVSAHVLFNGRSAGFQADLITILMLACGVLAMAALAATLVPRAVLAPAIRSLGPTIWLAFGAACLSIYVGQQAQHLWRPTSIATFYLVRYQLALALPAVHADPLTHIVGSDSFRVTIDPACSGYEGLALMLIFSVAWLWWFRAEYRFPAALLLVPVALATIFLLNSTRIASLILIGHAGAPGIAMGGFHSQAGWISFNLAAIAFCALSIRTPLLAKTRPAAHSETVDERANPVAPYLIPFLAILAAGMISKAFSAQFEYLYPLRFAAALFPLWYFRRRYRQLDWRAGVVGIGAGLAVFAIWVAFHRSGPAGPPAQFAALPSGWQTFWLACRILGTCITVPIAEELAFRGFFYRRLLSENFESVPTRAFSWIALGVSSLAFGLLHGGQWMEGTIAGAIFAGAYMHRGRIGDAVAAHALANALLVVLVFARGDWSYW